MNPLEQAYYESMFVARYPAVANAPGDEPKAPSTETEAKPAKEPLRPMDGKTDPHGSAQEIPRNSMQKAIGNMGSWIQSMAEQLDKYGVKIKLPGTDAELNPTLKDVTVGDMGRVLEDISYGFYPVKGKGMTTGLKPEAVELANLPILVTAGAAGAKAVKGVVNKALSGPAAGGRAAQTGAIGPITGYENVSDQLMGFTKKGSGKPNKAFDETKYPFTQYVVLTDERTGDSFVDATKGMNAKHALERAKRNWHDGFTIEPISKEEAAKLDPAAVADAAAPKKDVPKPERKISYDEKGKRVKP